MLQQMATKSKGEARDGVWLPTWKADSGQKVA